MREIITFVLFFIGNYSYAQYDNFFNSIISPKCIFKPLKGEFVQGESKIIVKNGEKLPVTYSYQFNNKFIQLDFFYPKSAKDGSCSYFKIEGTRINLKSHFEEDFACDLDVTSFNVYQGSFRGRNYLLLTCINNGSGSSTTSVVCNLFDITDRKSIKYYPLWSKYGSSACFGDFNKDGILDFLKIRYFNGKRDNLRIDLTSLQKDSFIVPKDKNFFLILKLDNDSVKILKKNWF
jgi:hypothetical protein